MMNQTTGCLSEFQVAECAEAILNGRYSEIPESIRMHIDVCNKCASEVMMVAEIVAIPDENVTKKPIRRSSLLFVWGAAAAVIVFFIVARVVMRPPTHSDLLGGLPVIVISDSATVQPDLSTDSVHHQGSIANESHVKPAYSIAPEGLIAALEPNANLDQLVARSLTSTRNVLNVKVLSPQLTHQPGADSIRWSNPDHLVLTVEWFNNKAQKLFSTTTKGDGVHIPVFSTGLYYWKLVSGDADLLHCGKVVVK